MIPKPIEPVKHIHFMDTDGLTFCGNRYIEGDTHLIVQDGAQIPDDVIHNKYLCGVCWCVWLSIKAGKK